MREQLDPIDILLVEDSPNDILITETALKEGRIKNRLIVAYQKRKVQEIHHRVLREKLPIGLAPHIQARLLARHLRNDLKTYPPFLYR